jgi:hypothetical protein
MSVLQSGITKSLAVSYDIDNSLRFDDNDSAYLGRTFSAGDTTEWTFSCWVKRGNDVADGVSGSQKIFGAYIDSSNVSDINFSTNDIMDISEYVGGSTVGRLQTTQLFRDFSAWYHIVVVWDSDNGSSGDRYRLYVNGDRVTAFSTETQPSSAQASATNAAGTHNIGKQNTDEYYDGYLAEMYFIDGQSLAASDFGELDSTTNQWIPKDASDLTFGTNGFYQKYGSTELADSFEDSSNAFTPTESLSVNYLVVAGGGGGGDTRGGGGGAGGMLSGTGLSVTASNYPITLGAGGAGGAQSIDPGASGGNSVFSTLTATGGGGGAGSADGGQATNGGSGGGGTQDYTPSHGTGISGQGNDGGTGAADPNYGAGGGGGKGAVGTNGSTTVGGNGGVGESNSITGSAVFYAGGGGGGTYTSSTPGSGGNGGGGDGKWDAVGGSGTANTGGGGGGGGHNGSVGFDGGAGGSGIVIISYISTTEKAIGGTITSYTDGGDTYQVHTFTNLPHTITDTGDVTNTRAVRKVDDSSIIFDGSNYLSLADSVDWEMGSFTDYTFEMWLQSTAAASGTTRIWATSAADSQGYISSIDNTDGTLTWLAGNGSGWGMNLNSGSSVIVASQWHHVAYVKQGTTGRLYVDGVQKDSDTFYDSDSYTDRFDIGRWGASGPGGFFTGYMTEIRASSTARYPDGTTFTPSTTAFTADANTLLLIHSNWDGGLGADSSGNYNTFTPTNLVATDQMIDTPTNNWCTLNSVTKMQNASSTLTEGNLQATTTAANWNGRMGTMGVSSGKWYWEIYQKTMPTNNIAMCGIVGDSDDQAWAGNSDPQGGDESIAIYGFDGNKFVDGSDSGSYGVSYTAGDIIGVALNMTDSELTFYKNNVAMNSGTAISFSGGIATANSISPLLVGYGATGVMVANFGQDSSFAGNKTAQGNQDSNDVGYFYYEPPTDYLALCTDNLSAPEIALPGENFESVLYTGDNTNNRAITGVGFQPDLLWVKRRNSTSAHMIFDAVRGASDAETSRLAANTTAPESLTTDELDSFDSDGFTIDTGMNGSGSPTYAALNWKAGGAPTADNSAGAGATPTAGSVKIDGSNLGSALAGTLAATRLSANTTAGFSIVKYVGTGATATIAHGLGVAPELVIVKSMDSTEAWNVYAEPVSADPGTDYLTLNTNANVADDDRFWNDTVPSPTVFTVGSYDGTNKSTDDLMAYCFHSVEGYSKVGTFITNSGVLPTNNLGVFQYCGFKPALIMLKGIDNTSGWMIWYNAANTYNLVDDYIVANTDAAEVDGGASGWGFLSNGFKQWEGFSGTWIFYAVAESPFKYSNAR